MTERGTAPIPIGPMTAGAEFGEGRYTLGRLLGTGGMASVWSATDARLHREVAIKIISDTLALDPEFVARFDREARIVAGISHPHVVQVYDYGAAGTRPYLVMEYVSGGTLSAQMRAGRADWNPVTLAREILDALTYIHAAGVLHRDLKPANVLLGADGRARLTDFGIAHLADAARLTSTGLVVGTQKYLAPEILTGAPATASTDLYSCGVLLAECAGPDALVAEPLRSLIAALTDPVATRRPPSAAAALLMIAGPGATHPTPTRPMTGSDELPPTVRVSPPTRSMTVTSGLRPARDADHEPTAAAGSPAASRSARGSWGPTPVARRTLALVAAGAAVVLTVVLAVSLGGGAPEPLEVPAPGGSVAEQLDQLDDAVDRARR